MLTTGSFQLLSAVTILLVSGSGGSQTTPALRPPEGAAWTRLEALEGGSAFDLMASGKDFLAGRSTLYRSSDDGRTWTREAGFPPGTVTDIAEAMKTVWVAVGGRRLVKLEAPGKWTEIPPFGCTDSEALDCRVDHLAGTADTLYVATRNAGIFQFKGGKWTRLSEDALSDPSSIAPEKSGVIAAHGIGYGAAISRFAGKGRREIGRPLQHTVWLESNGSEIVAVGERLFPPTTAGVTVAVSTNGGKSWSYREGPEGASPSGDVLRVKDEIYVALSTGILSTRDGGKSWKTVAPAPCDYVADLAVTEQALLVSCAKMGILRWDSGSKAWQPIKGFREDAPSELRASGEVLLVRGETHIHRCSRESCERIGQGSELSDGPDGILWTGDGRVSLDAGSTWLTATGLPQGLTLIVGKKGNFLALASWQVFGSSDGLKWEARDRVKGVAALASAGSDFAAIHAEGRASCLSISSDGGRTWKPLLPCSEERDLSSLRGSSGVLLIQGEELKLGKVPDKKVEKKPDLDDEYGEFWDEPATPPVLSRTRRTWRSKRMDSVWSAPTVLPSMPHGNLDQVVFNDSQAWIATSTGVLVSTDSGDAWTPFATSPGSSVRSISLVGRTLFAVYMQDEENVLGYLPLVALP